MFAAAPLILSVLGLQDNFPQEAPTKELTMRDVQQTVTLYQALQLPLPPPDAPLVVLKDDGGPNSGPHLWGYLLPGVEQDGKLRVLVGTHISKFSEKDVRPHRPSLDNVKSLRIHNWGTTPFEEPYYLTNVVAEYARGRIQWALDILKAGLEYPDFDYRVSQWQPPNPLRHKVGTLAVMHWVNESFKPGSDRGQQLAGLNLAVARIPEIETEWVKGVIRSFKATLETKPAAQESPEALIDSLLECTESGNALSSPDRSRASAFKPLIAIAEQGFAIVPTLIAHLEDQRLTRAYDGAHMNNRGDVVRVGDVCSRLIEQVRGERSKHQPDSPEYRAEISEWWAAAEKSDEEKLCFDSLVTKQFPSDFPLLVARKRFPEVLLKAYDTILSEGKSIQTWPLLDAMQESTLDKALIETAALKGSRSSDTDSVHAALWTLCELSSGHFAPEMVRVLDSVSSDASGFWMSREASFAQIAASVDTQTVWDALMRLTKRANVDLRLELLNKSRYVRIKGKDKLVRLRYAREFFSDAGEANAQGKRPPFPGDVDLHFDTPTLKIRLLARVVAADILELKVSPEKEWTDEQWTRFEKLVDKAVADALGE